MLPLQILAVYHLKYTRSTCPRGWDKEVLANSPLPWICREPRHLGGAEEEEDNGLREMCGAMRCL
jgi:hypothetical protein